MSTLQAEMLCVMKDGGWLVTYASDPVPQLGHGHPNWLMTTKTHALSSFTRIKGVFLFYKTRAVSPKQNPNFFQYYSFITKTK